MGYGKKAATLACAVFVGWFARGELKDLGPNNEGKEPIAMSRSQELSDFFTRHPEGLSGLAGLSCEPDEGGQAPYWKCQARETAGSSGWIPYTGARDTRSPAFSFEVKLVKGVAEASASLNKEFVGFKPAASAIVELAKKISAEQAILNPKESAAESVRRREAEWAGASVETLQSLKESGIEK